MIEKKKMLGAVFLGDRRLCYTAEKLRQAGIELETAENASEADQLLLASPKRFDFVLLPGTTPRNGEVRLLDGITVNADGFLQGLRLKTPVFTGHDTPYMLGLRAQTVDCFADERLTAANAGLTAEGMLYLLLGETPRGLYEYRYDVLGAGRTGSAISRLLTKLGLPVRIVTRNGQNGTISIEDWLCNGPGDIVICTVPERIVTHQLASGWGKAVFVMDITTAQIGVDPAIGQIPGIQYLFARTLPAIVAPQTAGELIAEFVLRTLLGNTTLEMRENIT